MFKNIRDRVNTRLGNTPSETANPVAEGGTEESVEDPQPDDKEDAKEERRLVFLLEKARKAYIEKGLVGSIEITRSFAAFYRTVSCDIESASEGENVVDEEVEEDEKMSRLQKMAVAGIDRCIKALEKRAQVYRNKSYKSSLSLTSTLYVTAPFVGLVTINISCSATVESLLAAK